VGLAVGLVVGLAVGLVVALFACVSSPVLESSDRCWNPLSPLHNP